MGLRHLALKLAGVVSARKHSCRRVREPRELPPFVSLAPSHTRLVSLAPSHTRRCTWRGGKLVECLVNLRAPLKSHRLFTYSRVRSSWSVQFLDWGLSTAGENEFSKTNQRTTHSAHPTALCNPLA